MCSGTLELAFLIGSAFDALAASGVVFKGALPGGLGVTTASDFGFQPGKGRVSLKDLGVDEDTFHGLGFVALLIGLGVLVFLLLVAVGTADMLGFGIFDARLALVGVFRFDDVDSIGFGAGCCDDSILCSVESTVLTMHDDVTIGLGGT